MNKKLEAANANLSQKAYETLKHKIKYGELKQGELVSITAVAEELHISRTPVTIACQRLEYEKLLTIAPKQGVIINSIAIADARELYEMRAAIESYSAKLSFEYITEQDIAVLQESLERQKVDAARGDVYAFMEEDTTFHDYLLKRYKNSQISDAMEVLYDKFFMIGVECSSRPERLKSTIEEHEDIVRALIEGNKNAFVDAVEHNIINGYRSLTNQYSR